MEKTNTKKAKIKTNTSTLQIRLPLEMREELNTICSERDLNTSQVIRELIYNWINEQKNHYT